MENQEQKNDFESDTTLFIRNKEVWKDGEIPSELNEENKKWNYY